MMRYHVEQYLPCKLAQISTKINRKVLPDFDSPLFISKKLFVYPMHHGYFVDCEYGQFYLESVSILEKLNGKSAREFLSDEEMLTQIEQLYFYNLINYQENDDGLIIYDVDKKYFAIYQGTDTTWFSFIPQKIEIDLTNVCNLNCIHCAKDASPKRENGSLSLRTYVDIIKEATKIGVPELSFMGGEPTCHPQFLELAFVAKSLGIRFLATSSNGWLINRDIAQKIAILFDSVQISLHGSCPDIHDVIVGRHGAFKRAVRSVELLKENNIQNINISFTVMKENIEEMDKMVQLANRLDVDYIRFLVLTDLGRGKALSKWTENEKIAIADSIKKQTKNGQLCVDIQAGGFPPYCEIKSDATFYGCPAGRSLMYISADGEVKSCGNVANVVGNIKQNNIMDIWHNPHLVKTRRKLNCDCPYDFVCSGGCLGNQYWYKQFFPERRL